MTKLPTERSLERAGYDRLVRLEAWVREELKAIDPNLPLSPYREGQRDALAAVLRRLIKGG